MIFINPYLIPWGWTSICNRSASEYSHRSKTTQVGYDQSSAIPSSISPITPSVCVWLRLLLISMTYRAAKSQLEWRVRHSLQLGVMKKWWRYLNACFPHEKLWFHCMGWPMGLGQYRGIPLIREHPDKIERVWLQMILLCLSKFDLVHYVWLSYYRYPSCCHLLLLNQWFSATSISLNDLSSINVQGQCALPGRIQDLSHLWHKALQPRTMGWSAMNNSSCWKLFVIRFPMVPP